MTIASFHPHAVPQPPLSTSDRRWTVVATVAGLHLLVLGVVLQIPAARQAVRVVVPLVVTLIAPPQPTPAPPAATQAALPPPRQQPPPVQRSTPPQAAVPAEPWPPTTQATPVADAPAPAPVPSGAAPPIAALQPVPVAAASPPVPVPAPAAPTLQPVPPRKVVAANAVRYLIEPPVEVPRASRRAGEHGTVWLRVVVGTQGLPVQVSVARSSGYSRLDEQALWAMRQARFKPHTEDGRAVEVEVTAPIEYPLE